MIPARLAFFDAILSVSLFVLGPLGAHLNLIAPLTGFQLFLFAMLLAVLALLLGAIASFRARGAEHRQVKAYARFATVVGGAIGLIFAFLVVRARGYPPINDITTDFDNPPEFIHASELIANRGRDLKYDKAKYAEPQRRGYGKLEPLSMGEGRDAAFARVRAAAARMLTWQITDTDPARRTLEGVAASRLFHFQDDFVIEVRPVDASHSMVEMRSKSRDGVSDLGVNFLRIERFLRELAESSAAPA